MEDYRMEALTKSYMQSFTESARNCKYWEEHLKDLRSVDLTALSESFKVPILVPVGNRILFRGELKHTGEVTVSLGADYFVKCSTAQAEKIRQHRIRGAQEKLDAYTREYDFILNQMTFQRELDVFSKDIIEHESEEEYKAWKVEHEANVKAYKQKEKESATPEEVSDDEIFHILEKLEIREELMKEFTTVYDTASGIGIHNNNLFRDMDRQPSENEDNNGYKKKKVTFVGKQMSIQTSTIDLLHQIMATQNNLEEKLNELRNSNWEESKTEEQLIKKLDTQEQLEDIQEEIDRLDDLIACENNDLEESETESDQADSTKSDTTSSQRRVSFIDETDCNTLHINFRHSEIEPSNEPFDPDKGIQKPSDIYVAYSNFFDSETVSILKKCTVLPKEKGQDKKNPKEGNLDGPTELHIEIKVGRKDGVGHIELDEKNLPTSVNPVILEEANKVIMKITPKTFACKPVMGEQVVHKTNSEHKLVINETVLKDLEKTDQDENKQPPAAKPMSLFKKKRMQDKMTN